MPDNDDIDIEIEFKDDDDYEEVYCHICNRKIKDDRDIYSYSAINRINIFRNEFDIDELFFCSKKCWKEYILREAEKIRLELQHQKNY